MDGIIFNLLLAAMLSTCAQVFSQPETYRGAVVEYSPVIQSTDELTMAANVENYVKYIEKAARKKVDIIVFPEGGLFSKAVSQIPDPVDNIAPCDDLSFPTTEAVRRLSLASKTNDIYSVVNLLEKRTCPEDDENCSSDGYYIYNTNVVFDRRGVVIARYAKYNLFDETSTNRTKNPELVFFDTDFGVRFGTFICFDILFPTPTLKLIQQYRIKDFVFSTFWFSELPFLTALQAQRGWAETNNVNLLASGVNFLSRGSTGSGIYNGKYGDIVHFMSRWTASKLLIADIPKFRDGSYSDVSKRETHQFSRVIEDLSNPSHFLPTNVEKMKVTDHSSLSLLKDQIELYSSEVIEGGKIFEKTVCSPRKFCCDFYVNMDVLKTLENITYRAVVFNGVRNFGQTFRGGVQSCGVVACDGLDIKNCTNRMEYIPGLFKFKEIRIKGNFKNRNSLQFPSTLTDGEEVKPLPTYKYEFTKKDTGKSVEVSLELLWPVIDLHTFAIWGRDFTRDMEPKVPDSKASVSVSPYVSLVTFLAFLLFAR